MHGAGPRRGFAPDDARAGTGGGAGLLRVSAATRKTRTRRYLALGPHEARASVFRVSSAVTAKRLCARFEGVPLSVTRWWPRRAPQAHSAPQLWAGRGRGNFEAQAAALASCPPGGRGRVELVSVGAATATELGALPTGCFQPLGNPEAGRPPSRKPRAPSTGERTRGAPHGWWGASGCPAGDGGGEGERATPCSRHTGDLRPRAERTARPRRDPGAQVGRAAPSSPSALGTATVAFGMKGGTARASGELGRSHVLRGPSHAGGRRPERFPLPSGAKSLPVGAGFPRVAPLQAETKVEGPLRAERTNVTPGKATATTVPCHRPQKPRLRTPPRCHGPRHRRDLLRANGAAPP